MSKDGGPAFPCENRITSPGESGMSLRDYFAAAALQGLSQRTLEAPGDMKIIVQAAYTYADAMLAERSK